jgi:hypothetical protein
MIIIKLNQTIKPNSVCIAFADNCCVALGVIEAMLVAELQQISLEILQFLIHQYSQEKKKRIQIDYSLLLPL